MALIIGIGNRSTSGSGVSNYTVAWDGNSVPDVTKIPAGVTITYNGTQYTGTLEANKKSSVSIYLVKSSEYEYDRYIAIKEDGSYEWVNLGSTKMFPDITVDADGVIYIDGEILTEAIKNAKNIAEADHQQAESDHTRSERVYDTIFPQISSIQPLGGFAPNIVYILGTISNNTTFTLAEPSDVNINNHYYFTFDTGEIVPTITWPIGITWLNDEIPTLEANAHYEVSIRNNYAIIGGF